MLVSISMDVVAVIARYHRGKGFMTKTTPLCWCCRPERNSLRLLIPSRSHHNETIKVILPRDKAMDKANEIQGAPGKH